MDDGSFTTRDWTELGSVERDWFTDLADDVRFETVGIGREGAILVAAAPTVPLVRSTTPYAGPHQVFRPAHVDLIAHLGNDSDGVRVFNNVMVERYDYRYRTMGAHTDYAIDLAEDSCISIFSCYSDPSTMDVRSLVWTCKKTGATHTTPLNHGSVVTMSTAVNRRMRHKIVALAREPDRDTVWLGVTLRTSKRAVTFDDAGAPWLRPGVSLVLADDVQRARLFKLRGAENRRSDFTYYDDDAACGCTVSPSDLLPPE